MVEVDFSGGVAKNRGPGNRVFAETFPEHNPNPVIKLDHEGNLVHANSTAYEIVDQLNVPSPLSLLPPEYLGNLEKFIRSSQVMTGQRSEVEGVHFAWSVVPDKVGNTAFIYGANISEHIRAEQDLRDRDAKLRRSQKMDAIGQLASGMAHDFKNVLTAVLGFADLSLLGTDLKDSDRKNLGEIKKAARGANAMIQQLLTFASQRQMEPQSIDINETARNMKAMLTRLLPASIKVQLELNAEPAIITADASQIEQSIINLVINARDAIDGNGVIAIRTHNIHNDDDGCADCGELSEGDYILLEIEDNGSGMNDETKLRLFEPFYTTKGDGDGTGLGLANIYGSMKQIGGNIHFNSTLGKGTVFHLMLPKAG